MVQRRDLLNTSLVTQSFAVGVPFFVWAEEATSGGSGSPSPAYRPSCRQQRDGPPMPTIFLLHATAPIGVFSTNSNAS
jgi:hypothetical protein